jgi:hypothetical protein
MSIRAKIKTVILGALLRKAIMTETEIVLVVRQSLGAETSTADTLSVLRELGDTRLLCSDHDPDLELTKWTLTQEGSLKAKQL